MVTTRDLRKTTHACHVQQGHGQERGAKFHPLVDQVVDNQVRIEDAEEGVLGLEVEGDGAGSKDVVHRDTGPVANVEVFKALVAIFGALGRSGDEGYGRRGDAFPGRGQGALACPSVMCRRGRRQGGRAMVPVGVPSGGPQQGVDIDALGVDGH